MNFATLSLGQEYSISYWLKLHQYRTSSYANAIFGYDGHEYLTEIWDTDYQLLFADSLEGDCGARGEARSWDNGNWYHITIVKNYASISFYIDSVYSTVNGTTCDDNTMRVNKIGGHGSVSSYLIGSMDEVRIYNRIIDSYEIQLLYNSPSGHQPPIADTGGPYQGNTNQIIALDGTGSTDPGGTITTYEWDLDDDGQYDDATGPTPIWSWSTSGTHTISLQVTDNDFDTDADDTTVNINAYPTANINGPYYGNTSEDILLDATSSYDSDGSIVSYAWDLDNDGQFDDATGSNPNWSWSSEGTYTVSLNVTDDDGASDIDSTEVYISVEEIPPVARFTFTPEDPEVGELVFFDASGSSDYDGMITSYRWSFGDGHTDTGVTVSHIYEEPARYPVELIVTDDDGLTGFDEKLIEIGYTPGLPIAYFTWTPVEAYVNETVMFNASASFSPNGYLVSYHWDFDDGYTETGVTTEHVYQNSGNYSVNLTVVDVHGINASIIKNVSVSIPRYHNIVIDEISGGFGINVEVSNIGTADASEITWSVSCSPGFLGLLLSDTMMFDVIDALAVEESHIIHANGFQGIGPMNVRAQVDEAVAYASGFLLGPIMLRVKEL